jgi:hypothetical protein
MTVTSGEPDKPTRTSTGTVQWGNVAQWASVLVALVVMVFGGGWLWNDSRKPKLVYRTLPTYAVGTQNFAGMVVENRGQNAAHRMRVKVADLGATIQELSIQSEETPTTEDGGKGTEGLTVWLDRFLGGSAMTLYMITDHPVSLSGKVTIMAEECRGVPASEASTFATDLLTNLVAALVWGGILMVFMEILLYRSRRRLGL